MPDESQSVSWPPPVEPLNPEGTSDIVLLCEHASRFVPQGYDGLGLSGHDLDRHIAWDIGAAAVTRHLSQHLGAPAFLGTCSRLLIDLNRPLSAPDSIVSQSDGTIIPGNSDLSEAEKRLRAERLFIPFHQHVSHCLDQRQSRAQPTRLVSVHSFTPEMSGFKRPWHAGILFMKANAFALNTLESLSAPDLNIGLNAPYKTSRESDYGIPVHGDDRNIPAIMIEIRQDLISDDAGAEQWAQRLARALSSR